MRIGVRVAVALSLYTVLVAATGSAALAQATIDGTTESVPGTISSPWNVGGNLTVGSTTTGGLDILPGGVVTSTTGTLGSNAGSAGTVTVTGDGATWDMSNWYLYVGNQGTGIVSISEGASVENVYNTYIAYSAGSTGTVTVTGADSQLLMNSDIFVASAGQGTLVVSDGAYVSNANDAWIGASAGGSGEALVNGAGSQWDVGAELVVGSHGEGTLHVTEGGSIDVTGYFYAGYFGDGVGAVTVAGDQSEIHVVASAYIGYVGTGALDVSDGGLFRVDNDLTVGNSNAGAVTVSGENSELRVGTDAYIGYAATGSVVVSGGALFHVEGSSILGDGAAGSVTVTGSGSRWESDHIDVGAYFSSSYPDSAGEVVVESGGAIEATSMTLSSNSSNPGAPGTLLVTGAGSSVTLTSDLTVGEYGPGTATFANGGILSAASITVGAQAGSEGTLIVGAAAGEAPVAPGTLNVSAVSFGDGDGQMIFNHTGALTFSATVSSLTGTPTIDVLAGTTTFIGNGNSFAGTMNIEGGTAFINSNFGGTQFNVSGSGTLGGNDWVGGLNVMAGGTVAPGNSIGTLTVAGDAIFAPGSNFAVEVNGGQSDLLHVGGGATINGGTVHVSGGVPTLSQYTILETEFGLTGTFDGLDSASAFILYSLDYDLNNVYLVIDGYNALTTAARTPNQIAVANALDKFPKDNPLYTAIIGGSIAGAQQAFNALSGEIHASVGTALADDSRYVREAITGRLIQAYYGGAGAGGSQPIVLAAAAPTDVATIDTASRMSLGSGHGGAREAPAGGHNLAYWSRAFGAWGEYNTNDNAATTDRNLGGFITGVDGSLGGGWRAGLATGYLYTGLSVDDRFSSANINSYVLGGYAGGALGHGLALRSGGTWTWNDIDSARSVIFPGFFEAESANYNGDVGQLFAELAYPLFTHGGVIEPFAGLAYVHVGTDSFTESGPVAGLTSGGLDMNLGYGTLGARAGTTVVWGGTTVIPHAALAWQYAFGDTTPQQALAFASTGIGMGIGGVPLAQNSALIEVGADALIAEDATLGLSYIGQYAGDFTDTGLRGRFNWKF